MEGVLKPIPYRYQGRTVTNQRSIQYMEFLKIMLASLGVMVHTFNRSTQEAKAGESLS